MYVQTPWQVGARTLQGPGAGLGPDLGPKAPRAPGSRHTSHTLSARPCCICRARHETLGSDAPTPAPLGPWGFPPCPLLRGASGSLPSLTPLSLWPSLLWPGWLLPAPESCTVLPLPFALCLGLSRRWFLLLMRGPPLRCSLLQVPQWRLGHWAVSPKLCSSFLFPGFAPGSSLTPELSARQCHSEHPLNRGTLLLSPPFPPPYPST